MILLMIRAITIKDVSSIVKIRLLAVTEKENNGVSAPEFAVYSSTKKLPEIWSRGNRLNNRFEVFMAEA
jgi:hypothetical protein